MELLTPVEFAKIAKINAETARRWCRQGLLPCVKVGRRKWLINAKEIEKYASL